MLDDRQKETLRVLAATHAQWLKSNPDVGDTDDDDRYPMYIMATGFLRLYYEAIGAGIITIVDSKEIN